METKTLIIALIEREGKILLRKKPAGSKPYTQTWYLFGCEPKEGEEYQETLRAAILKQTGISIDVDREIGTDAEVKEDHDGRTKKFIYKDMLCRYVSGSILTTLPAGVERIEWVDVKRLPEYDLVPPTAKLLRKLNYL